MKKAEIISYLNSKYNIDLTVDCLTINDLKTFLNFEQKGYRIEKITKENYYKGIRLFYGYVAIK